MSRFFGKDTSLHSRFEVQVTKTFCFPALLDLTYLAATAASVFGYNLHAVTLIGVVGIIVNFAKSYILSASEKNAFPFWWFVPCLALPWSTLYALNKGLWQREEHTYPAKDRFRISATVAGLVLLFALLAGNVAGPLNNYGDKTLSPLEKSGQSYLLETSKQVGIAFATARLLNGMLSMIEELEVSAELGVGASMSPGEILEPLDDLVERFSIVMLINFVTVNGLLLLGEIGKIIGLAVVVPLGVFLFIASMWGSRNTRTTMAVAGYKMIVLGLFLYILVPAIGAGSLLVDQIILKEKQVQARQKMPEFVRQKVKDNTETEQINHPAESGFFNIFRFANEIKNNVSELKDQLSQIRSSLPQIIESITEQIIVFVLKSIVLPLIFLLVILRFYKWLTGDSRASQSIEEKLKEIIKDKNDKEGFSP
ncbi:MAG: hypothetical protein V5A74_07360 [Desulfohalobiaceae bacterium]